MRKGSRVSGLLLHWAGPPDKGLFMVSVAWVARGHFQSSDHFADFLTCGPEKGLPRPLGTPVEP